MKDRERLQTNVCNDAVCIDDEDENERMTKHESSKNDADVNMVEGAVLDDEVIDDANEIEAEESTLSAPAASLNCGQVFSSDLLSIYYNRLFPFSLMYRWLCYGNDPENSHTKDTSYFRRREFSMTLEGDIYLRYRSFKNKEEFKTALRSQRPIKIDLGACYNVPPSMKNSVAAFVPQEKEFVIDIDLTDYDDVRTCCSAANICNTCWQLMTAAVKVIDTTLKEDFGFQHLLWVYSGRRGIHCWVCDKRARVLSNNARIKIAQYLCIYEGNEKSENKISIQAPLHPAFERAYTILLPYFEKIFIEGQQTLLDNKTTWNQVLKFFPEDIATRLRNTFESDRNESSAYRWKQIKRTIQTELATMHSSKQRVNRRVVNELELSLARLVFTFVYPRLDINVSKQLNHLLKSPFVAHPKTGRVCVPLNVDNIDEFNPLTVPHLGQLNAELIDNDTEEADGQIKGDNFYSRKTSLRPYLAYFRKGFVEPLERSIRSEKQTELHQTFPNQW